MCDHSGDLLQLDDQISWPYAVGDAAEARAGRRNADGSGVSIRSAGRVLSFAFSSGHCRSRGTDPAFPQKFIKEICATHVLYGYQRDYSKLRRDDWCVNFKSAYALNRAYGLQLPNKTPDCQVKARREDRAPAFRPNDVWTMDFMHEQLATGYQLRTRWSILSLGYR